MPETEFHIYTAGIRETKMKKRKKKNGPERGYQLLLPLQHTVTTGITKRKTELSYVGRPSGHETTVCVWGSQLLLEGGARGSTTDKEVKTNFDHIFLSLNEKV
ncbi:uncharacterized protein LOC123508031 isoform X1 [Portunus trituberculatus]|uniref:uncharacterized protein LOC123508031 isoform X1 n=1 Tax=Portunus trituberculatus TaxID=210409 RepID=UPI001E1D0E77|nr:uncharacterized protein LOC123508031 isoform X1 [Portunus trituberculatus]